MRTQVKKATGRVASLIKRIRQVNFSSREEIVEGYEQDGWNSYYYARYRQERFDYYFQLFDLEETLVFEELTDKEIEQNKAIWKLVDLEGTL